jgi:hypothetical protein
MQMVHLIFISEMIQLNEAAPKVSIELWGFHGLFRDGKNARL